MALTRSKKWQIQKQVEEWIINMLALVETEDIPEIAEIIRQTVEDLLESEVAEREHE